MSKHQVAGSERKKLPGAVLEGAADPGERLEVTLLLRHNAIAALQARVERLSKGDYSQARLTHKEFASKHGARPEDIAAVSQFAKAHHLSVVSVNAARRSIVLSGVVKDFDAAFGVKLQRYEHPGGAYRGREGTVGLPAELKDVVLAVLGLDNRPQVRPHFRKLPAVKPKQAAGISYKPTDVAALYGFPAATGAGQTIAIVEFGGGSRSADISAYFKSLGLKAPKVVSLSVDHGTNHATGSSDGPDGEVMLDIEVAGSVAPGATLAVYYAPNTDAGFLDAVSTAIHDDTYKPSVLSISWGGPESSWTPQAMTALDQAFQDAAALGITVCIASGDGGSSDGQTSGNHVDFPASSPHVLACGGTRLIAKGEAIANETVWNDLPNGGASGGGVSTIFPLPGWQQGLAATPAAGPAKKLSMRGVPDVAGDADPQTGYAVRVDGDDTVYGGTSAVAPLWAGLIARINQLRAKQKLPSIGFLNPVLYANPAALNDIAQGNNGAFAASAGWDACTGLGSPDGQMLAAVLVKAEGDDVLAAQAFTAKSNAIMAKGYDLMAKGKALIDQANAMKVSGNAMKVKGNAMKVKGNAETLSDKAMKVSGNAMKVKGNAMKVSGNGLEAGAKLKVPRGAPHHNTRPHKVS
jgi:kumamolisin